jgi:Spy/CpxP family protein refolding chaperone
MTRKIVKTTLLLALAAASVGVGGVALARHGGGGWHGPERMKAKVTERIDEALDVAKATQAQKSAVYAARDHVFATFEESHADHRGQMEKVLTLFEADKVDPAQIAALRAEHEARAQRIGDAIVQALYDVHDALTPPQRKLVADWARSHKPGHMMGAGGHHGRGAAFFKAMVSSRIDEALDAAHVTDAQRARLHETRDRVFAVVEAAHEEDPSPRIEQALTLFQADKLDAAKVAELRAQHMAQSKKVGDALVAAVTEVHDVLTAPQRKALTDWIRAQGAQWHEGHEAHEGHGG